MFCFFIDLFEYLVSPTINDISLGRHGHVQKSRNHEYEGFSVPPITKSKSYSSKLQQENSTELSGHSFKNIYSKDDPQTP